jgi:putative DNA primase/helicase
MMTADFIEAIETALLARGGRRTTTNDGIEFRCFEEGRHRHGDLTPSAWWSCAKRCWSCRACGTTGGAVDAAQRLGIPLPRRASRREVARWRVRDATGAVVADHVRLGGAGGGTKAFIWERNGTPGLKGLRVSALPLYGAHALAAAAPTAPVVVTEGEKACDALTARSVLAVGTVTGAGTVPADAVLRQLAGRDVILWPDHDADGRRHMARIGQRLALMGTTPRWVEWREAPAAGDAADWTGTDEALRMVLAAAAPLPATAAAAAAPRGRPPMPGTADDAVRLTDVGNASRLVARYGNELRYCAAWKKWLVWDGRRWAWDDRQRVREYAKAVTRDMLHHAAELPNGLQKAVAEHALRSQKADRLRGMIDLAQSDPAVAMVPTDFDADPWLLTVRNGTLDLRTGQLREHRRADLITKLAPVTYDPTATLDVWTRFLADATQDNADLIAFLQRCVGYSLTGSTREEVLFFLLGPEASGKSTFAEAIKATFGDYQRTADFETFLQKRGDRGISNDIAALAGARLVVSIEVADGKRLAEGLVKQLTGGDAVTARFLHQEFFDFIPQFKLWFAANDAPRVRHGDRAIWRRIRRIPFERTVPEDQRDPAVKATLKDPARGGPAILAWAVAGCLAWQREGLRIPDAVREATATYRAEQDPLRDFFADHCVFETGAWTASKALYDAYRAWADSNGAGDRAMTAKTFGLQLAEHGCRPVKLWRERKQVRGWLGIRFRTEADEASTDAAESPRSGDAVHEGPGYGRGRESLSFFAYRANEGKKPETRAPSRTCTGREREPGEDDDE